MRWLRPKSLSGLMLLGVGLLALLLLIAIVTAAVQFSTISATGQSIVNESVNAARESQRLFSEIDSLERTARLYDVLDDPRLLQLYERQNAHLSATRDQLYAQASGAARRTLMQLAAVQNQIRSRVLTTPPGTQAAEAAGLSKLFAHLGVLVDRVAEQSNQQIDADVATFRSLTARARAHLFWQAGLLVPLMLLAVFVLTLVIGRPLRQIDRAISELGHGRLHQRITVRGPHDL
ncbi:integral membrane sensor signal transduction histidine kinase, partial [mine drainage metagenome]